MRQKGLGKGLNALLSEEAVANVQSDGIKVVDINDVEPNYEQPRKKFSPEELNELMLSIQEHGILQPLLVRQKGNKYEIIAGERRYRAARLAKLQEVPIIVKDFNDEQALEVALIENVQREDLNPMELACAYSLLIEKFDYTQDKVAERVGKSRSSVTNILRLLNLSMYVQEPLREDKITLGHAKIILALKEVEEQKTVVEQIIENNLSVKETGKLVEGIITKKETEAKKAAATKQITRTNLTAKFFYKEVQESLQKKLGTKVVINSGKKKSTVEIEFYNTEQLEKIISMIHE